MEAQKVPSWKWLKWSFFISSTISVSHLSLQSLTSVYTKILLEQLAFRDCATSVLGGFQDLTEHGPEQQFITSCGSLKWPHEVSSHLSDSVVPQLYNSVSLWIPGFHFLLWLQLEELSTLKFSSLAPILFPISFTIFPVREYFLKEGEFSRKEFKFLYQEFIQSLS